VVEVLVAMEAKVVEAVRLYGIRGGTEISGEVAAIREPIGV
jgi:hypothetical protein